MEDGDDSHTKVISDLNTENNASVLPNMANYPDIEITVVKNKSAAETTANKVNGESDGKDEDKTESSSEKEDSTDDDALVIDEEYKSSKKAAPISRKRLLSPSSRSSFKGFKKRMLRKSTEVLKIVNDCISATESGDGENIASEDNCDKSDEKTSQGESLNVDSQDTLAKNVKSSPESPIQEDTDTPALVSNPLSELVEAHTQNTNAVPESENDTNSQENGELLNQDSNNVVTSPEESLQTPPKTANKLKSKKNLSPKLTEYAQYLGLQPTVKFKCYKCSESTFPSMNTLNEHQQKCLAQPTKESPVVNPTCNPTSTNFRVTRKVYLCSACGTYYENWNLFLHMREVHRRFICLYCLGMFSLVEKLTQHLISKHNCAPTTYTSAEDYLDSYKDSCFLMCCHCEKIFTEQENFFQHVCTERATFSDKSCWSCGVKGTNPHLVSCKASIEQPKSAKTKRPDEPLENNMDCLTEPSTSIQKTKVKTKKPTKKPFSNVEHITADSPSNNKPLIEKTCDIANLCTVDMEPTIKSEPGSPEKSPRDDSPPENPQDEQQNPENQNEPENTSETHENTTDQELSNSPKNEPPEEKHNTEDNQNPADNQNAADSQNTEDDKNDISSEAEIQNEDSQNGFEEKQPESLQDGDNTDTQSENEIDPGNISAEEKEKDAELHDESSTESRHFVPIETNSNETITKPVSENSLELPQSDSDRNLSVSEPEMETETAQPEEIRRVPKVTLKLPPPGTFSENDSEDSEKLTMEVDENEDSDPDLEESQEKEITEKQLNGFDNEKSQNESLESDNDGLQVAGDEVPILELELDQPLDKFTTEDLLKTCLNATIPTCIYCNHARKIAVNGKNLGLHAIAEHRFAATVNSITAEELIPNSFVLRIKEGLSDVEDKYFNLDVNKAPVETTELTFKREYECFQCRYITAIHKELYLHNRKMHAKTILLCIMCKSNFYSYSELICHLCPGDYVLNSEMKFRCCMCEIPDLPSAFRLMVHLRKRHHTCDVCLEGCQNQSRLSNHVWKHKLHHLCYRCGIAYRNKPDITKHLFWKHGTESVLCKKCLQKKWPHVYHFCIPPTAFVCEECNLSFSRAVYLKVHKRLHIGERKHFCSEDNCTNGFVSRKLLLKHEKRHREPDPIPEKPIELVNGDSTVGNDATKPESLDKEVLDVNKDDNQDKATDDKDDPKKNIIDVYDLPALNLSESDSSDSEEEKPQVKEPVEENNAEETPIIEPLKTLNETNVEEPKSTEIVDGIWENFKQYQATIEKRDGFSVEGQDDSFKEEDNKPEQLEEKPEIKEPLSEVQEELLPDLEVIMVDHDYCRQSPDKKTESKKDDGVDHDYCNVDPNKPPESKTTEPKKSKDKKKTSSSSDSSSDSDSSSCTCGSNCSCSSSSGSSSSSSSSSDSESSTSEGKRRIAARRERRKERAKRKKESETSQAASNNSVDVVATEESAKPQIYDLPIEESDLETDETETDEDFYDEHPQRLVNKMLEEKRNQLLLLAGVTPPVTNGSIVENSRPSTPSIPEEMPPKKRVKSKKRKKKSRCATPKREVPPHIPYQNHQSPLTIQPPTPILPQIQPVSTPIPRTIPEAPKTSTGSGSETDSNLRASKRRRVPNKFYGYSSDDESSEKPPAPPILKWRKADLPTPMPQSSTPKIVPPITIKNIPSPAPIVEPSHAPVVHHSEARDSDSETEVQQQKSSSESSDSNRNDDSDSDGQLHISSNCQPQFTIPPIQRNENLYCYCQCPYDEVSEMIACDGRDCSIEWFHFECVGIMVPPKGKWYCPDCRKKAAMRNDYIQA